MEREDCRMLQFPSWPWLERFISLGFTLWLLGALLCLMVAGAVLMPGNQAYGGMNEAELMKWLLQSPLSITWWIWASVALLAALALQTLLCSADSLLRKRGGRRLLLVISPQVIHMGFLFMLLAHLVSSLGGFKGSGVMREGEVFMLPAGVLVRADAINVTLSEQGYPLAWRAEVSYLTQEGSLIKRDTSGPNAPSFHAGYGLYVKQARPGAAFVEVTHEPGAPWALVGGLMFTIGTVALIALKIRHGK